MLWITDFGGCGDKQTDNSQAFAKAFAHISALGGGELGVPAGTFLSGPLELPGDFCLFLDEGAVISFIPEFERYRPVWTRWEGVECFGMHPLVYARDKENVRISGKGIIDGNGQVWWKAYREIRAKGRRYPETAIELELARMNSGYEFQPSGGGGRELQFLRPPLLQFFECRNVQVEGITLQNSPFWNTHPVYCSELSFDNVTFRNPADAPNTDGLDIDSCNGVEVRNCTFDVGDDCLAFKSGAGEDGIRVGKVCENIVADNCRMIAGHGGIVIGSETAGGVRNIEVSNCRMYNTDRGLRIKTRRGRGGTLENLSFRNIFIEGCKCPLVINSFYRCGADPADVKLFGLDIKKIESDTPLIRNIKIDTIEAVNCRSSAGFIVGLPEQPITGLEIRNCRFEMAPPEDREPIEESAMYAGLPESEDCGMRLEFLESPLIEGVSVLSDAAPVS
ncbi:glycoside hydrolase family 28 protein [Spirochaeta dissipatitropha]